MRPCLKNLILQAILFKIGYGKYTPRWYVVVLDKLLHIRIRLTMYMPEKDVSTFRDIIAAGKSIGISRAEMDRKMRDRYPSRYVRYPQLDKLVEDAYKLP